MPELAKYINDPNWVQRGEDGKVTGMRAELLPYVFRDELGEQFRDMTRGGTKESNVMGDLVFTVILGVMTMGVGTAAASAAGLTATTAGGAAATGVGGLSGALTGGAGLSTTGSVVAGGVSGGLSAAAKGGNIGTGILTGGIGGAASGLVSNGIASTGVDWLDKGTLVNNALTKGTVGAATTFARGGDAGDAGVNFLAGAGSSVVMEGLAYNNLTTGMPAIDSVVGSLLTQTIGGAINPADAPSIAKPKPDTTATTDTPDTPTASVPVYRGGRVNYVKR
jgi:hypothetical protein